MPDEPRPQVEELLTAALGGDAAALDRLVALLGEEPALAAEVMRLWRDHPRGASPLSHVAMHRYDTAGRVWRDVTGTGPIARALIDAGAPVEGLPADRETPLVTAASYGDADVARVLIEAGADVERPSSADSGGVPGGTALLHAAVFGMTDVIDVLVAAGARVPDLVLAAAAGDVSGWDVDAAPEQQRVLALVMAADHQRIAVVERLVEAGTPVDAVDPEWGRHPLRTAAENGRPASVRRLLQLGADPAAADERGRTPLQLCGEGRASYPGNPGYAEVQALLGA